jgi:Small Multidrug Resistance protein
VMGWVYLLIAVACEVWATTALRQSNGFHRVIPDIIVVLGYAASFLFLSFTLRYMQIGPVYAIWAGIGTAPPRLHRHPRLRRVGFGDEDREHRPDRSRRCRVEPRGDEQVTRLPSAGGQGNRAVGARSRRMTRRTPMVGTLPS